MGRRKKKEHCSKIELAKGKRKKEAATKKDPILESGRGRVYMYVLYPMSVTFPTCQAERSPLKAAALENTAPHSNKEKSKDKNGLEKKRGREHCSKIELVDRK